MSAKCLFAVCLLLIAGESMQIPQKKAEPNPFMNGNPPKKVDPNPYMPKKKTVDPNPNVPSGNQGSDCNENDEKCVPKHMRERLARVKSMGDFQREFKMNDGVKMMPADASQDSCQKTSIYKVVGKSKPSSKIFLDGTPASSTSTSSATISVPTDTGCVPRWELYSIPKPMGNNLIWPSCIYTKQCGGCCISDVMECVPSLMKKRSVDVYKIPYSFDTYFSPTIDKVNIYDHVECDCRCKVGEDSCIGKQVYDKANCQCTCPEYLEKHSHCPAGKYWNNKMCDCYCDKLNKQCENRKHQWSEQTCQCECKPVRCGYKEMQDIHTCMCVRYE